MGRDLSLMVIAFILIIAWALGSDEGSSGSSVSERTMTTMTESVPRTTTTTTKTTMVVTPGTVLTLIEQVKNTERLIMNALDPMAVREFTVKLVTDPVATFPSLWSKYRLINEEILIRRDHIRYYEIKLNSFEKIEGYIESNVPVDLYILDKEDLMRFVEGKPFYYYKEPSRENIYSSYFEWEIPYEGTYYIVVYAQYEDASVKLVVYKKLEPYSDKFPYNIVDSAAWYIWIINVWVAKNIHYVDDPTFELVQDPIQTLRLKAGDCDDVAVLIASMYQSVGLKTKFALVDTDGDEMIDHVATLVYYPGTPEQFMNSEKDIAYLSGLVSKFPKQFTVRYISDDNGIWIIADPLFSESDYVVGMITRETYKIITIFP